MLCDPAASSPLQSSSLVPPRFEQREPLTRQSMSLSMPVRLTLTSVAESRLNSYDSSPAPVSDTVNDSVRALGTDTTGAVGGSKASPPTRERYSSSPTTAGFVSRLATRIIEISDQGVNDFLGSYDEYLERLGDDHLDRAAALQRAKREKREKKAAARAG